jgi:hypothetical protein
MAATFQNYDGGTFLSHLVKRPEFLGYIQEDILERCAFIQSGVMTRNSALDCKQGGVRLEVPFFQPIDPVEEQIRSDSNWGTSGKGYLTPQKITASSQVMTIMHRGFSYAVDDLSKMGTGADPMAAIRSYLSRAILKLRTRTLLSQLDGLFAAALQDNIVDVSALTGEEAYLNASAIIQAKTLLGERGSDLTVAAMNSATYGYLEKIGALTFSTSSLSTGGGVSWGGGGVQLSNTTVSYFMGMRVLVDDLLLATGTSGSRVQPVYLFGPGVIAEGVQQELRLESERNILSLQDVIAVNYHYGQHIMGTSWVSSSDNPDNAALTSAANYSLAYSSNKMIPIVKLLVKTPYDL